jgi:hypothetical protein
MKTYIPFLRGKQNEMMALRELAAAIAESGKVLPLIEPVKSNATTRISVDRFIEESMPFILICNPQYGDFSSNYDNLFANLIDELLPEYDNWTPALQVRESSTRRDIAAFLDRFETSEVAIVYWGLPDSHSAQVLLNDYRLKAGRIHND